ncbi:MAG: hypothetical protein ACR2NR_08200 [Solirubrobacteraceae bacterium]
MAVAHADLGVFTAGLEPPDEEATKAVVGNAWKSLDGITAMDALDRVSEAVQESLTDGPRPRDDFHQALRGREGRSAVFGLPSTAPKLTDPGAELVRRLDGTPAWGLAEDRSAPADTPQADGVRLLVTVEPLGDLATAAKDELAAATERIARARGADIAELRRASI